jgi:AcrR family transcriptional regulator
MSEQVSLRARHAAETRQRILDVAFSMFIERGFDATTVDAIADGADVSPRTFFRYFGTKEALLFHDFEERLAEMQGWIHERPADEEPARSLVHVLCRMVGDLESTPERRALMVRLIGERPSIRSYQRTTIAEHAEQQVTGILASRAGVSGDDLGLRATVAAVSACFDIALHHWIEHGATASFSQTFSETLCACARALPADLDIASDHN